MIDPIQLPHKLTLNERKALTVTGVREVVSFDDTAVLLHTNLGTLLVQGQQLQLKSLNPEVEQMAVEGQISALSYEEPKPTGGFFRRLLG